MYITKRNQLPPSNSFSDNTDVTNVLALLRQYSQVAIAGQGGAGLANRVGHQSAELFPDGQLWLQFDHASTPKRAIQHILETVIHAIDPYQHLVDDLAALQAICHTLIDDKRLLLIVNDVVANEYIEYLFPPRQSAILLAGQSQIALPDLHTFSMPHTDNPPKREPERAIDITTATYHAQMADDFVRLARRSSDGLLLSLLTFDDVKAEFKRVADWLRVKDDESSDVLLLKLSEVVLLFGQMRFFPSGELVPYLTAALAAAKRQNSQLAAELTDKLAAL